MRSSEDLARIRQGVVSGDIVLSTKLSIQQSFDMFPVLPAYYRSQKHYGQPIVAAFFANKKDALNKITTASGLPIFLEPETLTHTELFEIEYEH